MDYSLKKDGSTCQISFRGQSGFADNEKARSIIEEIKVSGCSQCSIDLKDLESIDSAGLGMLLIINDAVQEDSKSMVLSGAKGQVQKMLDISKFAEIITIKS